MLCFHEMSEKRHRNLPIQHDFCAGKEPVYKDILWIKDENNAKNMDLMSHRIWGDL